mgnify:CR=1 FL=1
MISKSLIRLLAVLAILAIGAAPQGAFMAHAKDVSSVQTETYDEVKADLAKADQTLKELTDLVDRADRDDSQLADLKIKVEAVAKDSLDLGVSLQPRFALVTKRLAELGDPPAADQPPEQPIVTADRTRLQAEKAEINALTSHAEAIATEAGDLANHVTDIRRDIFAKTILARTNLTSEMAAETGAALSQESDEFVRTISSWAKFVWTFKRNQLLAALALSLVTGLALVSGASRIVDPLIHRRRSEENPLYITRLTLAFWSTVLPTLSLLVYVVAFLFFLLNFNVLRPDIAQILSAFLTVLIAVYFLWRLARAVLAPGKPQWRLVDVSDRGARLLVSIAVLLAAINGLDYALEEVTKALDSPVVLTIAKGMTAAILIGIVLIAMSFIRPMNQHDGNGSWPRPIRYGLLLNGFGLIGAALFGYVGLASFVSTQIVISGAILVTMYIGLLSGKAVSHSGAFAKTAAGQFLARRHALTPVRLDQTGLVAGLGIYLIVLVLGVPLILLQWGFQIRDIQALAIRLMTEIRIGNINISLFGILGGVLVFAIGLVLTRWLQRWLDGNVMVRSQVDSGVRNSVNTALGYAGVALAGLLGVSAAGIDLSSLALVAGALSLGIGFGLQNIVSNFVSGLILLAERPFKVGDWVVTGKTEGFVKRISVRATEIETFQHQSIIVPNSELINSSLGNWTHRNKLGRSEVAVGVSYDADPRRVMDILLEIANAHPLVLKTPEPFVAFLGFGDFELNFELRIYLADLLTGTAVRNDIRLAIFERFRLEGIEIPYPQRNLNIRFDSDSARPESAPADKATPPEMLARLREQAERSREKTQDRLRKDEDGETRQA